MININKHPYIVVYRRSPNLFSVRAGFSYSNTGGSIHSATRITVHANYNSNNQDYDVAIVQVSIPFNVSI